MTRRRTTSSLAREVYYILCMVMFIVSVLFAFWGPGGWRELKKAQMEMQVLRTRVDSLGRQNEERLVRIQNLKSRNDELERIARDAGFAQDGEIIQRVPSDLPAQDSLRPPSKP